MENISGAGDLTIRTRLLPGDLGSIAQMHGKLYAEECGYGLAFEGYVLQGLHEFSLRYSPGKDRVWICEDAGRVVGFLVALNREEEASVQLRYFILLPGYRGLGLGRRLMDLFIGYMRENGCHRAYLWTTNEQHAAVSLYTRYGFRLTEEKTSNAFGKLLLEQRYDLVL
ncbi:MAG: GNAT family N-acetyltransferase [Puia sp.]|nr:GNAT family N-acetyltransferase [Puia sp.]